MSQLNVLLVTIGGLVIGLGLLSGWFKERLFLSDPILTLLAGILLSPVALALVRPDEWGQTHLWLEEGARLAIAVQVMGVALRLPSKYIVRRWKTVLLLLGPVMVAMWLTSSVLAAWILHLPFWQAALVGAIVTPTDPVVSTSVVTGKVADRDLPERLRHTLSAESGANDGLGYAFVLLPILMLNHPPAEAVGLWLGKVLLWEVGGSIALGLLLGYAAGWFLRRSESRGLLDKHSFLAYTVALSLLVVGAVKLVRADGILAVFVAGSVFSMIIDGDERSREEGVQDAVDRLFTLYIFVLLGLTLPWQQWGQLGWPLLAWVVAVLLLRRLPALLALRTVIPAVKTWGDSLFLGWFGPVGVAAIFYANLAARETEFSEVWAIASAIICASIFVHGFTSVPFSDWYERRSHHWRDR